jgi:hypothetical protein
LPFNTFKTLVQFNSYVLRDQKAQLPLSSTECRWGPRPDCTPDVVTYHLQT